MLTGHHTKLYNSYRIVPSALGASEWGVQAQLVERTSGPVMHALPCVVDGPSSCHASVKFTQHVCEATAYDSQRVEEADVVLQASPCQASQESGESQEPLMQSLRVVHKPSASLLELAAAPVNLSSLLDSVDVQQDFVPDLQNASHYNPAPTRLGPGPYPHPDRHCQHKTWIEHGQVAHMSLRVKHLPA
jgi:hypothetical protein